MESLFAVELLQAGARLFELGEQQMDWLVSAEQALIFALTRLRVSEVSRQERD